MCLALARTDAICADCHRDLPRTSYTSNQYSKGEGLSRCAGCVHGHHTDSANSAPSGSGRYNASTRAEYQGDDLDNPFASGRAGQACVCKWFKSGSIYVADYFTLDIKAVDKALELVNRFNQLNIVSKPIKINVLEVWTFAKNCSRAGVKVLQEPFIQNYQKFNSNTGWTDTTRNWSQAMQALSHFSYHISGGNYVLCDLQGGIYQSEAVLSDPAILSRNREYGVTDLGSEGISSFFSQHECNGYCRPDWTCPSNPIRYFEPRMGTSMLRHTASAAFSKPRRTDFTLPTFQEDDEDDYY
ncbi:kinase-like domain-containing protein [Lasiosphaeris hirsuta]|uniref:Kinase-like domain-containing protein n=1 Tax=Lasiosphaeris hirsuta TaxID=260670 RepID=A0AA40A9K1_9PEZI|nr:kinase-like domain-containing protein [Lasiosphaeris hirsuta]